MNQIKPAKALTAILEICKTGVLMDDETRDDLEERTRLLGERCHKHGLHAKGATLLGLPDTVPMVAMEFTVGRLAWSPDVQAAPQADRDKTAFGAIEAQFTDDALEAIRRKYDRPGE